MTTRLAVPGSPVETWFHGTDQEAFENILAVGFNRVHNWFADSIEHAQNMGGPYVLGVTFQSSKIPVGEDGSRWQMCVHEYIPPEVVQIVSKPE